MLKSLAGCVSENHKAQFEQLPQAMDVACETENANLYSELNLKFNALVLLLANNQRAQAAYEAIVKGSKAKSTAEKHVLKGRERLLSNIGGTTPLAGL